MKHHSKARIEFGDFQTPDALAVTVMRILAGRGLNPASIVEPTCGTGSLLTAAVKQFPKAQQVIGLDINSKYLQSAAGGIGQLLPAGVARLLQVNFFTHDWQQEFAALKDPILAVGNPPWATSSQLAALKSTNVPAKSNHRNDRGLDAITGKANFDIAEWMVLRLIELLSERQGALAMLLKTSVARKILAHCWRERTPLAHASLHLIDAATHFDVDATACLLLCEFGSMRAAAECEVFDQHGRVTKTIGFEDGMLLADAPAFLRNRHLLRAGKLQASAYRWRSGIKHDCSAVMELTSTGTSLINGFGEEVNVDLACLYPMLKGSAVGNPN